MQVDELREFSEAVFDLAERIERDSIDSSHLDAYMLQLITIELLELPASCRAEIKLIARLPLPLSPSEIGWWLRLWVAALNKTVPVEPAECKECSLIDSQQRVLNLACETDKDHGVPWLSELCAAIFWITSTVILMAEWRLAVRTNLHHLLLLIAACFSLIGLLSAWEVVRLLKYPRQSSRSATSRLPELSR